MSNIITQINVNVGHAKPYGAVVEERPIQYGALGGGSRQIALDYY